jgi:subtilisin family serine protease
MTDATARRALSGIALAAAATTAGLFALAGPAFAAPATAATGTVRGADLPGTIKDSYIVVLKDGTTTTRTVSAEANDLVHKVGGAVRKHYDTAVKGFSANMTKSAAQKLAADPSVKYVEQDRIATIRSTTQTNPPSWGLDRIDQTELPLSKSYTYGSAGNVTAYIIDTGVRLTHSEFGGRARSGWDFVDNDADASDCQGHGTHVAGTVGGATYGVAKDVKLVAVRVLDCNGSGSYSQIIAGVDWVTKNAVKPAVANMSLGGAAGSALDDAVQRSIDAGVTYAVAGGNDGTDACTKSPARLPDAITVGATDSSDKQASFSNYGTCLDLYAPGVNILSSANSSNTATMSMSGTSMATPHVTGAAALYLAENPTATPAQVRDALVGEATEGVVKNANSKSPNKLLYVGKIAAAPAPTTPTTPTTTPTTTPATKPTTPATPACGPLTNNYARPIADKGSVESKLTVAGCTGKASATTKVTVHVKTTDRGDYTVFLVGPDGTTYKMKNAVAGDDVANLDATYTVNAATQNRNGLWRLRVQDMFSGDIGTLTSWSVTL